MNRSRLLATALLLPLLSVACVAVSSGGEPSDWSQVSVHVAPDHKLGGCVLGDFDPDKPGDELVVTASDGAIHYLWRTRGEWATMQAFQAPGEMIQCAAGDLDPNSPGDELVVVGALAGGEDDGGQGAVWIGRLDGGTWAFEKILEDEALVHAVCIGELDPEHPGVELLVAGYTREVYLLSLTGGEWRHEVLATLEGRAKGAASAAGKAYVTCAEGQLVQLERGAEGWSATTLEQYPQALARIAARDDAVLFSANDGCLRLWRGGESEVVYRSGEALRGAVLYELDPQGQGLELATAGYDGLVTVISTDANGERHATTAGSDSERLHHLAVGEVAGLGSVLVACGYSGRLILLQRVDH